MYFDQMSRRTFLRGAGVALALPFLDAMFPYRLQAASLGDGSRQGAAPKRLIAICNNLGVHEENFFPTEIGLNYSLTPYLQPLAGLMKDFTVVSGLSHPDVGGGHASEVSFLTAAPGTGTPNFRNSVSLDQYAAAQVGGDTRFDSLVLTTGGMSMSWSQNGTPIPPDSSPSQVFARLFLAGSTADVQNQVRNLRQGRSILDVVSGQAQRMSLTLGAADRDKLDEYFTGVREVEGRLVKGEEWSKKPKPVVTEAQPIDSTNPADIVGRSRLMYDLIFLAIQTDSTRVVTLATQGTSLVPPIQGVSQGYHDVTHHGQDPKKLEQLRAIEMAEFVALGEFLTRLKATSEMESDLLDRSMVLYGSNLGNASSHDTKNLPILLAGGGFQHGKHLAFDKDKNQPLCNLYVSMLQQLGMEVDSFASSHGTLTGLA